MATELTAEWDALASRVRLSLAGAFGSDWATFQSRLAGTREWTTVRGGEEVPLSGGTTALFDYEFPVSVDEPTLLGPDLLLGPELLLAGSVAEYQAITHASGTVTAVSATDLTNQVWLKFPGYPYRNRRVVMVGRGTISRSSRTSQIAIASSVLGTAVGEFMSGRTFSLTVRTETWQDYSELDTALSLGSILLLHGDQPRMGLPNIYGVVTDVQSGPVGRVHGRARHTEITLSEVARPHHAYSSAIGSWSSLLLHFDDWQGVLDGYDSWGEVLELEGSPADVVVP